LDAPTAAYAAGVAVSEAERLLVRSGERTVLNEDIARRMGQGTFLHVASLCSRRESAPVLPRKPKAAPPRLTLELTDRALDLVHRRRRIDGLEQTLFLPGPLIRRLLTAELTVRSEARYDIAGSGWTPTSVSAAVAHARAGRRTSAETARVRELLREFHHGRQPDEEFDQLSATVCQIWAARYSPTATELVIPEMGELRTLLRWCKALGMPDQYIELRVPKEHQQAVELQRIAEEHGLPAEAIRRTGRLRLAQDRVRGLARQRVGFLVHQNPLGPLTGMNQFHRVMFTLCTYLQTLDTHA